MSEQRFTLGDWIEDLEISKYCNVVELLQNIDYSFLRYKNTIDKKDNNLKISVNFGDSHGVGFDMEFDEATDDN